MEREISYKKQGDGRDSWQVIEFDKKGAISNKYMVYEDPNEEKKVDISGIDIDSLTDDQLKKLKQKLNLL